MNRLPSASGSIPRLRRILRRLLKAGPDMNRARLTAGRSAVLTSVAATVPLALALAGCGTSSNNSGGSGQHASGSSSSSAASGGSSASAGNSGGGTVASYFPVAAGNTWVYKVTVGQSAGGQSGTATDKMIAVKSTAAGQQVTMTHTSSLSAVGRTVTKETLLFRPDGSIELPLTQFAGSSVTIVSGSVLWPRASAITAGQSYTSKIVMKVKGSTGRTRIVTVPVTVKGEGSATVTVPAGTYHATLLGESITMSFNGFSVGIIIQTWLANGIGPVKSAAYSSTHGQKFALSTEELVSFTKG
jgi:hypothetical protein